MANQNGIPDRALVALAVEARARSYSPYSGFSVGAALLCADGTVYPGCNVENGAYGECICAERTALVSAVAAGKRDFTRIAVVASGGDGVCVPCGACRQVLMEFAPGLVVLCATPEGDRWEELPLGELLPRSFALERP